MKFRILSLLFILICLNKVFGQDEFKSGGKKVAEVFIGASFRESIHLGFSFGAQTSLGGYIGGASWHANPPSYGINLKFYLPGQRNYKYNDYSPLFMRFGAGAGFGYGVGDVIEAPYLAFTFGRDIHFSQKLGITLEFGVMIDFEEYTIFGPILPAAGVKFFYHVYK